MGGFLGQSGLGEQWVAVKAEDGSTQVKQVGEEDAPMTHTAPDDPSHDGIFDRPFEPRLGDAGGNDGGGDDGDDELLVANHAPHKVSEASSRSDIGAQEAAAGRAEAMFVAHREQVREVVVGGGGGDGGGGYWGTMRAMAVMAAVAAAAAMAICVLCV